MNVKISGATASRSKMEKKGWKCWAMRLTAVASGGMPFSGDRVETGATAEMEAGDVILHVDDSSTHGVGVVIAGPDGGVISWIATSGESAQSLTAPAKKLLAMSPAERIVAGAKEYLSDHADTLTPEEKSHYMVLSDMAASTPASELSAFSTDALIRELASRGVTVR